MKIQNEGVCVAKNASFRCDDHGTYTYVAKNANVKEIDATSLFNPCALTSTFSIPYQYEKP